MNYFVDAVVRFKGDCDLDSVNEKIEAALKKEDIFREDCYDIRVNDKGLVEIQLFDNFEFYGVETLVKAAISAGLKKFGRDKLIAYQTTACCHFKNYVSKDGTFFDFCGDCP